jgi:hypothetical protein
MNKAKEWFCCGRRTTNAGRNDSAIVESSSVGRESNHGEEMVNAVAEQRPMLAKNRNAELQ